MARKNSHKNAKKRHETNLLREQAQQKKLEERKLRRRETRKSKMDEEQNESSLSFAPKERPLKRKATRRLENERARLAKKGLKLVPLQTNDEMETEMPSKRLKISRSE